MYQSTKPISEKDSVVGCWLYEGQIWIFDENNTIWNTNLKGLSGRNTYYRANTFSYSVNDGEITSDFGFLVPSDNLVKGKVSIQSNEMTITLERNKSKEQPFSTPFVRCDYDSAEVKEFLGCWESEEFDQRLLLDFTDESVVHIQGWYPVSKRVNDSWKREMTLLIDREKPFYFTNNSLLIMGSAKRFVLLSSQIDNDSLVLTDVGDYSASGVNQRYLFADYSRPMKRCEI